MPELNDSIRFMAELNSIAEKKFSASTVGYGADTFAERIYTEYLAAGHPRNRKNWIAERLSGVFVSLVDPPVWRGEPVWPFHEGEPMVFLHQFTVSPSPRSDASKHFPVGDTVFVFGSKTPPKPAPGESWRTVFKLIVTDEDGNYVHADVA